MKGFGIKYSLKENQTYSFEAVFNENLPSTIVMGVALSL